MPYNGSGTYSFPSLPGSWNPAVSGQEATPGDWNTLAADLTANGLSNAICKDGQTTVTANISFADFQLKRIGAATVSTDAPNAGQIVAGALNGVADTGSANAYAIAPTIAITAYAAYQRFAFKAANTNTGASTIAVSGLTTKAIKHLDGTALLAGDIVTGELAEVMYDGTNFQLLSATGMRGTVSTWTAVQTFTAPVLGTPTSATLTNATGLPAAAVVAGALANGMAATTQAASDSTTKLATTAGAHAIVEAEIIARAYVTIAAGVGTVLNGRNISSVTTNGTGTVTVTMSSAAADTNYAVSALAGANIIATEGATARSTTVFTLVCFNTTPSPALGAQDPTTLNIVVYK